MQQASAKASKTSNQLSAEFLDDLRRQDRHAFRELLRLMTRPVGGQIRAFLGPAADWEDIMQEVFLRVHRGLPGFRGENLRAWIHRIARNCCLDAIRGEGRTLKTIPFDPERDGGVYLADFPSDLSPAGFLERLSYHDRELLMLRVVEGYSYDELSTMLDRSAGALRTRVSEILGNLRAEHAPSQSTSTLTST